MSSPEASDRVAVLHPHAPRVLDVLPLVVPAVAGETEPADVARAALGVVPDGTDPAQPTRAGPDGRLHVVVARTTRTTDGAAWVAGPPSGLPDGMRAALREVLAEDAGDAPVHRLRPGWHRRGWWDEATAWVDDVLARLQLAPRTGPLRPKQVWSMSAVVEVPTAATGRHWLKAVPAHFAREPAVIGGVTGASAAARAAGAALPRLPRVVGHQVEPGGAVRMLMTDAGPVPEDVLTGERERLAAGLARLQAATAPRLDLLAARAGLDDRTPAALAEGLAALTDHGGELDRLSAQERTALTTRLDADRDRLQALAGTGLPALLVHGDYHPWNAVRAPGWADGEEVALDWTDASVGVAGLDLVPLAGLRASGEVDAGPVADAYVEALADALGEPRRRVRDAVVDALPAAWLVQALAYEGIMRAAEPVSRHEFAGCQERALRGWLTTPG